MEDEKIERILNTDLNNDKEVIKLIQEVGSDILTGTFSNGEKFSLRIQKDVGLTIATYQDNGWIRINNYELVKDDFNDIVLERSESYEK